MQCWNLHQRNQQFVSQDQVLAPQQCRRILEQAQSLQTHEAQIQNSETRTERRQGRVSWLDPDQESWHWIYKLISDRVLAINETNWKFDLDRLEPLQLAKYTQQNDHYIDHVDRAHRGPATSRKLSFSCQLTDPTLYSACDLEICLGSTWQKASRNLGSITVFPSWQLHRVTALNQGNRCSLVGWMHGPAFK